MRSFDIWVKRGILIVMLGLLSACSLVRLGYNHGETILYWWLNSYVDFEGDQPSWVKRDIEQLFVWHRKTQLKDYSQLFARLQSDITHPVKATQVQTYYDEIKKRTWTILDHSMPYLADIALSLTPQQIAHIEKKFAANNDEYRKDYLHPDLEHRQKHRYKKVMEQAEYWFGSFSREQERWIRKESDARPTNNEWWMDERLRRQRELITLLKKIQAEKPNREATIALLRKYGQSLFERPEHPEHPEREAFFESARQANLQLTAFIINVATPAQKAKASKNLQKWIDTFNGLATKS